MTESTPLDNDASRVSDEYTLRRKVREILQTGTLPNRRPDCMWGGPGLGAECTICDAPIKRDEVEFEIEFARNGDAPGVDKYHVHRRCFAAWESERQNLQVPSKAISASSQA